MAGANNVQFKQHFRAADVTRARAVMGGVLTAKKIMSLGFKPKASSPLAGTPRPAHHRSWGQARQNDATFKNFARSMGVPGGAAGKGKPLGAIGAHPKSWVKAAADKKAARHPKSWLR